MNTLVRAGATERERERHRESSEGREELEEDTPSFFIIQHVDLVSFLLRSHWFLPRINMSTRVEKERNNRTRRRRRENKHTFDSIDSFFDHHCSYYYDYYDYVSSCFCSHPSCLVRLNGRTRCARVVAIILINFLLLLFIPFRAIIADQF